MNSKDVSSQSIYHTPGSVGVEGWHDSILGIRRLVNLWAGVLCTKRGLMDELKNNQCSLETQAGRNPLGGVGDCLEIIDKNKNEVLGKRSQGHFQVYCLRTAGSER